MAWDAFGRKMPASASPQAPTRRAFSGFLGIISSFQTNPATVALKSERFQSFLTYHYSLLSCLGPGLGISLFSKDRHGPYIHEAAGLEESRAWPLLGFFDEPVEGNLARRMERSTFGGKGPPVGVCRTAGGLDDGSER
jgi:hypothetical protein